MLTRNETGAAYAFLTPALIVMTLCGVVPMAIVIFYSVHDTFAGNSFIWVGTDWYRQVLTSPEFFNALLRSLAFSAIVLAIEIPLGILVALRLPTKGIMSSVYIVLLAVPLLTPYIVVGFLWKAMTLPKAGLLFEAANGIGIPFDMNNPVVVWATIVLMDVWHWTSLVVLLCFAALRAIPDDYYRAAQIDGANGWAVFRYVQLPKLRLALLIALLLRFMDSFMIYAEAYVIGRGGPDVSTTFLSNELVQTALIQFDLGEGGAMSVIYLVIVLAVSWTFFGRIVPKPSRGSGTPAR